MFEADKIKDTLNLPQTSFSMKAKLASKEPEFLKRWEQIKLYQKTGNYTGKQKSADQR